MSDQGALWTLREVNALDPDSALAVRQIAASARDADSVASLSEQVLLNLDARPEAADPIERATRARPAHPAHPAHPADDVVHLLAESAQHQVIGYAQLWGGPPRSAEVVVAPPWRRHGVGTGLLRAVQAADPHAMVWAHGDLPGARAAATRAGMRPVRALHLMSLDLTTAALPEPVIPDDLAVRPFRPGADDAAWLAANAATFADHPEQGRWRQSDLDARIGEPWFDPAGFHLVVPTSAPDTVAAYHWTKRTSATDGEVYVVGIHPTHQGRGLGSSVTLLGLRYLRDVGVRVAHLYVDDGNARALATYTRLGFVVIATDRMYSWV